MEVSKMKFELADDSEDDVQPVSGGRPCSCTTSIPAPDDEL